MEKDFRAQNCDLVAFTFDHKYVKYGLKMTGKVMLVGTHHGFRVIGASMFEL